MPQKTNLLNQTSGHYLLMYRNNINMYYIHWQWAQKNIISTICFLWKPFRVGVSQGKHASESTLIDLPMFIN